MLHGSLLISLSIVLQIHGAVTLQDYSKVSKGFLSNSQPTELVVPRIYDPQTKQEIFSTADEGGKHLNQIEIALKLKNTELLLDLHLDINSISNNFKQIYKDNGHEKIIQPGLEEIDYCHYTGKIRNKVDTWVALSTCDGISGIINDENEFHFIEKSYNSSTERHLYTVPLSHTQNDNYTRRRKRNAEYVLEGPYNENENPRYIEFGMIFDNGVYNKFGDVVNITSLAISITNMINAFYSRINIFVILVGVEIWTEGNPFVIETGKVLDRFTKYVDSGLIKKFEFDNVQLITSVNVVETGIGLATVASICDSCSTAVNDYVGTPTGIAITIAHELGHNLGLMHDDDFVNCTCPEPECIMVGARASDTVRSFSSCSIKKLQEFYETGTHYCLNNRPETKQSNLANCGNGVLEEGEECDCGLPEFCDNHCCLPLTCKLTNGSECASGKCCDLNKCQLKKAATPCRPATNECDLSEYCTGKTAYCPKDTYKLDTEVCNDGNSYCHQGLCGTTAKCSARNNNANRKYKECYLFNFNSTNENNYCNFNALTDETFLCHKWWSRFTTCGNPKFQTLEFNSELVTIETTIYGMDGSILVCTLAFKGEIPKEVIDDHFCGKNQSQCISMTDLRKQMPTCPIDCNNNGWCNNKGQCHCKDGFEPPTCYGPGFGGSLVSGPSRNPYSFLLIRNILLISFLAIVPLIALVLLVWYLYGGKYPGKSVVAIPGNTFNGDNSRPSENDDVSNKVTMSTLRPPVSLVHQQLTQPLNGAPWNTGLGTSVKAGVLNTSQEHIYANPNVYMNLMEVNGNVDSVKQTVTRNPAGLLGSVQSHYDKPKKVNKTPLMFQLEKLGSQNDKKNAMKPEDSKNPQENIQLSVKELINQANANQNASTDYQEFARRKKKLNSSLLNKQIARDQLEPFKAKGDHKPVRPESPNNRLSQNNHTSVKDIIKKINSK